MRAKSRGFTLVEILIVVIILGCLAALIVPQFTRAGQNDAQQNLQATLQNLRGQIQLYRMQHGNTLPDLTSSWSPLTQSSTFGDASDKLGPYIGLPPVNPMNGYSNVCGGNASKPVPTSCGFVYDYNNGHGTGQVFATGPDGRKIAGNGTTGDGDFLPY